ncbi:MAG: hypothetical protein ACI4I5_10755 [Acutalibacteraceae bacterium]
MKCEAYALFRRQFSEIEGLQKASTLSYYADPLPRGVALYVREESSCGTKAESCVCPDLSVSYAAKLLQLACENNFGLGAWLDLLNDQGIRYQLVPAV